MRDVAITLFILGFVPAILRHPSVGVMMFAWLSLMTPYRFTYGFAYNFPFAVIVAACTILGLLITKDDVKYRANGVLTLMILLPAWTVITWLFALDPDSGKDRLIEVVKVFLFVQVAAKVLHTRKQLETMIWVLVFSIGFFGVKGGLFTILTGGGGRVYGPPGTSFLSDNNAISVAMILVVPLMFYLRQVSSSIWVRRGLLLAMLLSGMAILGSYSRGAFLAVTAMLLFLWAKSKRKLMFALIVIPIVPLALSVMPDQWSNRMDTISGYKEDGSAMGRINAWTAAFNLANDRPLVGGGFEWYSPAAFAKYAPDPNAVHAAHSIYFQMLGEHGYVGLILFLSIGVNAWLTAGKVIARSSGRPELEWAGQFARCFQASLIGYSVGGMFVNIGYWDLIYYEVVLIVAVFRLIPPKIPVR